MVKFIKHKVLFFLGTCIFSSKIKMVSRISDVEINHHEFEKKVRECWKHNNSRASQQHKQQQQHSYYRYKKRGGIFFFKEITDAAVLTERTKHLISWHRTNISCAGKPFSGSKQRLMEKLYFRILHLIYPMTPALPS